MKIRQKVAVFDIETNGLFETVTKVHCAVVRDLKKRVLKKFTPDNIKDFPAFLSSFDVIIGHNIIQYDLPVLEKILGYKYEGKVVDTLIMSRILNPKRMLPLHAKDRKAGPHSLYAWGVRCGVDKPEHEDWEVFSEAMMHRCEGDTLINVNTYHMLMEESAGNDWMPAFKLSFRLFECLHKQEVYGWLVDQPYMHFCIGLLDRAIRRIDKLLVPALPYVLEVKEIKKDGEWNHVKKPFLKSGEYSASVINYFGIDSDLIRDKCVGGPFTRVDFRKVDLNSNDETKAYLIELGWEPLEWNTNDKGERTSPKLSKDDPYEGISGVLGRLIARRVQCRQRRSIISGLLLLVREDGSISSIVNSLADTSRATHRNIVNIPKAGSFFGKQMRRMFVAREGKVLVSTDSDSCQLRMLGGRMGDPAYINAIVTGDKAKETDLHSLTRKIADLESRDIAKNVMYCLLFGGGDPKLGKTAKKPGEGADIRQRLYQGFDGLGEHMEALLKHWRSTAKRRWNAKWNKMEYYDGHIIGLDGRPVKVPFEHQLLVYELQSDEAIMMQAAYIKTFTELSKRFEWGRQWGFVCWYHDEYTIECDPDIAEEVKRISEESIVWAGNFFKIVCPHKGDGKIGKSWYEVH